MQYYSLVRDHVQQSRPPAFRRDEDPDAIRFQDKTAITTTASTSESGTLPEA